MKILKTKDLSIGYEGREVVGGIEMEVESGQIICLLGPNGCGKSTMLKTFSSLLAPVSGNVYIEEKPLKSIRKKKLSKTMAVVLTERLSVGLLTAFEVAAMGRYPHTGLFGKLTHRDRDVVWECIRMVKAEHIAERHFNELSDGERQKILLARALAQEPRLIILDEPTTHLDVRNKIEVMAILKRLSRQKGITVILSLHEVDLAMKTCDSAVFLKDGRIMYFGAPDETEGKENIAKLYDIEGTAGFSLLLGSVEMVNRGRPSVFVVGGNGKGTPVYRFLTKHDIGFVTGILHENDIDCHIADAMGAEAITVKAFNDIEVNKYQEALGRLETSEFVIDAGFPVSDMNRFNLELVAVALKKGMKVFSMRGEKDIKELYGDRSDRIILCERLSDIEFKH